SIAAEYWRRAAVAERVSLRLGPALPSLEALLAQAGEGSFDFAYIDADKTSYTAYYECCLRLLRPGGLLAVDNVLWGGRVIDRQANDADTQAIRAFNTALHEDGRVAPVMVPVGDGLTLAYKH
ncbi:MAG: class I SAM-dependent methyltransferase, partial [Gammaproteobacteria bacterium]|nr:class I SAM-dependent methyltransferase [Gammaproteobacteria bacterium]